MRTANETHPFLQRLRSYGLLAGLIGTLALLLGLFIDRGQFFESYLLGYIFWLAIPLGAMGMTMVHHLTGGGWGFVIRRQMEAAAATIPLMGLLFVPLLFGLDHLYPWTHPESAPHGEIVVLKASYLNVSAFVTRMIVYFVLWSGLALLLNRWSQRQDRTGNPDLSQRLKIISGPGIVLYVMTATFASVDWLMSLEPDWYSTIYGLIFVVGHALAALSLMILLTDRLDDRPPLSDVVENRYYHDLGNFLLAFVMLWAYLSFSQFLIIWSGNLPEEVSWYEHRIDHGWQTLALFLTLFHFAFPFLLLLARRTKKYARNLIKIAAWMLVARFLDFFWWIKPAFADFGIHWMDLAAPIAIGGIWLAAFAYLASRQPLLPLKDPRLEEAFGHKHQAVSHG